MAKKNPPSRKKPSKSKVKRTRAKPSIKAAARSSSSHERHMHHNHHLPGYLLASYGLFGIALNFNLVPGMEWGKAWPLLLVLIGVTMAVKVTLAKGKF